MARDVIRNPFRLNEFHLKYLEGQINPVPHPNPGSVNSSIKREMMKKIAETAKRNPQQCEVAGLILSESDIMTEWLAIVTPLSWLNAMLVAIKIEKNSSRCPSEIFAYMRVNEMMGMLTFLFSHDSLEKLTENKDVCYVSQER